MYFLEKFYCLGKAARKECGSQLNTHAFWVCSWSFV